MTRVAALVSSALLAVLAACPSQPAPSAPAAVPSAHTAAQILADAIAAHGGRENLAKLDTMKITASAKNKEYAEALHGTAELRAPDGFTATVGSNGHDNLSFWIFKDQCVRRDRFFVSACAEGDRSEFMRALRVWNARLLNIPSEETSFAPDVEIDGKKDPAIKWGTWILAFDSESHRLIQLRDGNRVETYSDFRPVGGAIWGWRRVVTIAGAPDIDDRASEIIIEPPEPLKLPEPLADGQVVEDEQPARAVAWTTVSDFTGSAAGDAVQALVEFTRAHKRDASLSDGLIWIHSGTDWKIFAYLEDLGDKTTLDEGPFHIALWPAGKVVGLVHKGNPVGAEPAVKKMMQSRGIATDPHAVLRLDSRPTGETKEIPLSEQIYVVSLTSPQ